MRRACSRLSLSPTISTQAHVGRNVIPSWLPLAWRYWPHRVPPRAVFSGAGRAAASSPGVSGATVDAGSTRRHPVINVVAMLFDPLLAAQRRERELIAGELGKVKGLFPLLMKYRNGRRWTTNERDELIGQMRAMAYLSPYLLVMVLPGSVVALPVLAWWLDRRRQNHRSAPAHQSARSNDKETASAQTSL